MKEVRAAAGVLFWLMVCLSFVACAAGPSGTSGDSPATSKPTTNTSTTANIATSKTAALSTATTPTASTTKTTASPAAVSKLTMKESFALLCQKTGKSDLMIYSYLAYSIDSKGKSDDWQIVGYSAADNKNYVLRTSSTTTKTMDINNPDQKNVTFYPLDRFKDSPEMVAETMVKTGGKWDDAKCKLSFVMGKTTAEAGALSSLIGMYEVPFLKP